MIKVLLLSFELINITDINTIINNSNTKFFLIIFSFIFYLICFVLYIANHICFIYFNINIMYNIYMSIYYKHINYAKFDMLLENNITNIRNIGPIMFLSYTFPILKFGKREDF